MTFTIIPAVYPKNGVTFSLMQLGDKGLEMFEKRFGRFFTSLLLLLIGLGVGATGLYLFVSLFVKPVGTFLFARLPTISLPEVNLITTIYAAAFIAVAALVLPSLVFYWRSRGVPQKVVDELAELRVDGLIHILNGKVTDDASLKTWEARHEKWCQDVLSILRKHFPKAEVLGFETLGVIYPVSFPFSFNNEHAHELSMFHKRINIVEDIIRRYTR
jgi:hypothetical protein